MSSNSSGLLEGWCSILTYSNISILAYFLTTLAACIVTSLLAPITVAGNALILAAIWKSPSLRTPSFVLLAGLAFTDFCTGLLSQPFYVMQKSAELTRNTNILCTCGLIASIFAHAFFYLTVVVMVMSAAERCLYMSRRSLLTMRRVVIPYIIVVLVVAVFVTCRGYSWRYSSHTSGTALKVILIVAAVVCFGVMAFSYFKVFRIIRHHQIAVQANQNAIDILKYKKSIFTILYIFAIFVLSYLPYVSGELVFYILQPSRDIAATATSCTFYFLVVQPLALYLEDKRIKDCCKEKVILSREGS